jgi:hypothetical protein
MYLRSRSNFPKNRNITEPAKYLNDDYVILERWFGILKEITAPSAY